MVLPTFKVIWGADEIIHGIVGMARGTASLKNEAQGERQEALPGLSGEGEMEGGQGPSQPFITSPNQLSPLREVCAGPRDRPRVLSDKGLHWEEGSWRPQPQSFAPLFRCPWGACEAGPGGIRMQLQVSSEVKE